MAMDYKKVASEVVAAVGKDSLVVAAYCATRLRLVLKDSDVVDQAALDNNADVKGTFKAGDQHQIVIGPRGTNFVYDELVKLTGVQEASTEESKKIADKGRPFNPVMAFIRLLSDIFVPITPALVTGGLLMALNNFLTQPGLFGPESIVQMNAAVKGFSDIIRLMSAAPFISLPVLVAISASKRFDANQFLGAAIGMIMTSPGSGAIAKHWDILGYHVIQTNYKYQVVPVLIAIWVLSILEKGFHKILPQAVDFTLTPLLSVMITGFLTFTVIGPVFEGVSDLLTQGIVWLYDTASFISMGAFGLTYSAIVTTGLHQSFPAVETQLVTELAKNHVGSGDFIFVVASMANVAQGAATLAIYFLTKNKKMKSLASSVSVSAFLGTTEPALFGVDLEYKFPFFCALIGSGVAAMVAGLTEVIAASMGAAGFIGFLSVCLSSIPFYIMCEVLSFAAAFVLTFMYGKKNLKEETVDMAPVAAAEATEKQTAIEQKVEERLSLSDEVTASPVNGKEVNLTSVHDQVLSAKSMGDGAAVIPADGNIYPPVDREATVAYEAKRAYGLKLDDGAEILIHIGIDTVSLKGEHLESFVKQGQRIKKGDRLGTADLAAVKEAGYDTTAMVIIINTNDYASADRVQSDKVKAGDNLIAVTVH